MRSKLPSDAMYEKARADYEEAVAAEEAAHADLRGGRSREEVVADLFRSEEEDDVEILAMLEEDPEGEKGISWEESEANLERKLAALEKAILSRIAAKGNLEKYDRSIFPSGCELNATESA